MSLSQQVEDSLISAQQELRNALSFSARSEAPYVSKHIADMMHNIDNLLHVTDLLSEIENATDNK